MEREQEQEMDDARLVHVGELSIPDLGDERKVMDFILCANTASSGWIDLRRKIKCYLSLGYDLNAISYLFLFLAFNSVFVVT